MEETSLGINQEIHEEYVAPGTIQSTSTRYSQIISQSLNDELDQFSAGAPGQDVLPEIITWKSSRMTKPGQNIWDSPHCTR